MAGDAGTPEQSARLRQQSGFDRPIWEQLFVYVGKVATFDFGESVCSRRPVATDILQRLPATLELTFAALLLSIVVGVPLGVVSALKHNTWPDYLLRVFSVMGIAVAAFWFAIMLQLFFPMDLGWLPLRGELASTITRPPTITDFLGLVALLSGRAHIF